MQLAYSFLSLIAFYFQFLLGRFSRYQPITIYPIEGEHHLKWNRCQSSTEGCQDGIGLKDLTDIELLDSCNLD